MNRIWIGAALVLAVLVGSMLSIQRDVQAQGNGQGAIVIKNDGLCGMPGSDGDGNLIFGGLGQVTTVVENRNKVMLTCRGEGLTNASGRAQVYREFACSVEVPSGGNVLTSDSRATVAANGNGSLTCTYEK